MSCMYWKGRLHFLVRPLTSPQQESHLQCTNELYCANVQCAICKNSIYPRVFLQKLCISQHYKPKTYTFEDFIYCDGNLKKNIKFQQTELRRFYPSMLYIPHAKLKPLLIITSINSHRIAVYSITSNPLPFIYNIMIF